MYNNFFGFKEKPFKLTPSPKFLYLSEGHKEALSLLKYGVMERMGFILLTGEVGTGKTTMVRTLLDSFDSSVKYVHLSNPILTPQELFNYLALSTFKKEMQFSSKTHFLLVFQAYLQQALKDQSNFILIIDEAHKLSFDLLEEIRLLSNMETGDEKLINIFLVGQPELNKNLSEPVCRALLQRISIRYHIPPLNSKETKDYIANRLKVAGSKNPSHIFSKSAAEAIYSFSRGFPREINVLADNALLLGYAKGTKKISSSMIRSCYEDLLIEGTFRKEDAQETKGIAVRGSNPPKKTIRWRQAAVLLLCLVFVAGALSLPARRLFFQFVAQVASTSERVMGSVAERPATEKEKTEENTRTTAKMDTGKTQGPINNKEQNDGMDRVGIAKAPSEEKPTGEQTSSADTELKETAATKMDTREFQDQLHDKKQNEVTERVEIATALLEERPTGEQTSSVDTELRKPATTKTDTGESREQLYDRKQNEVTEKVEIARALVGQKPINEPPDRESPQYRNSSETTTVSVKEGDTLTLLAMSVYGRADESILASVQKNNPSIKNVDWIYKGQRITFPPLSVLNQTEAFTVHIASYKPAGPALELFQKLMKDGYEVYMMPAYNPDKGKVFRITLGTFENLTEAEDYAATVLGNGVSDYARPVQLDMR